MRRVLSMVLLSVVLAACGSAESADSYQSIPDRGGDSFAEMSMAEPAAAPEMPAAEEFYSEKSANGADISTPLAPGERLVIRDASIGIEVEDVQAADQAIRALVAERQGYVLSSSVSGSGDDIIIYLTLKVPSADLDAVLTAVEDMAHDVRYRNMSGNDVTAEYVDLEGRLVALEAARDRLLELLKKAEKVEDAVAVNQALTDVQSQIESMTGRMRYLRQSAAMSSLTLELYPIPVIPVIDPDQWQPLEDARMALRDLIAFGQDLVSFVIGLVIWTPVWLPLAWLTRYLLRRRAAKRAASTPTDPPAA